MGRPSGAANKRTKEFINLYETLVIETGVNPVKVLFNLCKAENEGIRRQAASDLLPYRYPKQAAEQPEIEQQSEFLFSWEDVSAAESDHVPDEVQH